MLATLIPVLSGLLGKAIDRAVPDAAEAGRLKAEAERQLLAHAGGELRAAAEVILAEARGESWLQRSWRPLLMVTIVAIVANNFLLAPYLEAVFGAAVRLDLPAHLWTLMEIGVGGYIVGRTGEKVVRSWRSAGGR